MKLYSAEFLKDLYFHEADRNANLNSRIALVCTIYSLLIGASGFFLTNFGSLDISRTTVLLIVVLGLCVACIVRIFFILRKTIYGYEYWQLPAVDQIEELKQYYENNSNINSSEGKEVLINNAIDNALIPVLKDCISQNRLLNDNKANELYRVSSWLVIGVVLTGISFLLFFLAQSNNILLLEEIINVILGKGEGSFDNGG